jgi:two-component system phosphate regulon response regulator PhoB/two-component system alkaline phosphatase synthesis response regulator PhoP
MKPNILVVEDELDIRELIEYQLEKSNFNSSSFEHGKELFDHLDNEGRADLIILDLMLPDIDGLEICKQLKSQDHTKSIPIIMLTAKTQEIDKILGLELGADDYMAKPFSPRELVARIKAILRRANFVSQESSAQIVLGGILKVDLDRYEVRVSQKKVKLTPTEFKILSILSSKPGWVYSREKLLDKLWGNDKIVTDRTIDVHIKNLRDKLGQAGSFIQNIKSVGYKLEVSS